jgi:hypothetical protein
LPEATDRGALHGRANVPVGGSTKQITLQPVSVEGKIGLNVAAGLAEITLKATN